MSVAEIIEQIKQLPAEERRQVVDFVERMKTEASAVKYAPEKQFEESAQKVFREHSDLLRRLAQ